MKYDPVLGLKRILPSVTGSSGLSGEERFSQGKEKESVITNCLVDESQHRNCFLD